MSSLEEYLEQGPSDDRDLVETASWLKNAGWQKKHEAETESLLKLLATAVGKQRAWQTAYREDGIFENVIQELNASMMPASLAKQCLRVIGNCVADNDVNRGILNEAFGKLIDCSAVEELTMTALVVMFNLSNDYEPAHMKAAELRLDHTISECLAAGRIPEEAIDYATDLLNWTTEKLTPIQTQDSTSLKVFDNILNVSLEYDEEHYQEYIALLVHYLQDPECQQKAATPVIFNRVIDLLFDFETRLSPEESQAIFEELGTHGDLEKVSSDLTNTTLMVRLVNSISGISASDAFARSFNLRGRLIKKMTSKLSSTAASPSTVCACVILGNLAMSDQACIDIVDNLGLHRNLIELLSSRSEPAIIYAAAGFMRHLTFPEANRHTLGEAGLIETSSRLLTNADPSVRGEAAAILCKLVTNNFPNIEKAVYKAIPEGITPAELPGVEMPVQPTILYHIASQALVPSGPLPSTTMKNPMIELGRTIIAMLRYLRRSDTKEDVDKDAVARHMFKTHMIARPIARLVRQRFYADPRSEGLLGLGLMAQTSEGAACVVKELQVEEGLLDAIKEFAVDQKGEQQNDATAGRDYQNAVVLLHGLATHGGDVMEPTLKREVESLQTELSRLML